MASVNLLELARSSGEFNVFVAAVQAAGVEDLLLGANPLTVLAPTDAAFGGVSDVVLTRLIDPRTTKLQELVKAHLVRAVHSVAAMTGLGMVRTLAEELLNIDALDSMLAVAGAVIVRPDLQASNGLLHGIDEVLTPQRHSSVPS